MFRPKSLQEAISLAKLQEQANFVIQKRPPLISKPPLIPHKHPPFHTPYKQPTTLFPSKPNLPITSFPKPVSGQQRRLSPQEVDDKRSKGLCFWCDEKHSREHVCKNRRQLYLLEVSGDEDDEELNDESESEIGEEVFEDNTLSESHISMHAITGIHDFKTMRITGVLKGKPIHILIDTGSTHNFMDLEAAKTLGCKLEPITPFAVSVADGNKIHSSYICKGFSWKMQGVQFTADLMTIPLGGCDMVLGVQWLVTMEDINWNFSQLKMAFTAGNKKIVLRDALSRQEHEPTAIVYNISSVNTDLLQKIKRSWEQDEKIQKIIADLSQSKGTRPSCADLPVMLTSHGYLAHPWLSDKDREQMCTMIGFRSSQLTYVPMHLKTDVCPLKVMLQVLFFEQMQLRIALAGCLNVLDTDTPPVASMFVPSEIAGQSGWVTVVREN
ncbi:hypothetical protein BUALT_Bualt13G0064900 [Buddleja alternifolia]|uniref:Uncharacterized protein n=1 Tax=Buddleja alternifolia TaxID=168488 RepID=A0AAV6WWA2_9LAMI|nr:hypothetical protein BUALT_Bualt13G0064900 [Buddleja alternifolia]